MICEKKIVYLQSNQIDKMKYDPNNPLTESEINSMDDDTLFVYLDSRAEYLKKYSRPLDTYHTKQFLAVSNGGKITDEELKNAKKIGKVGDDIKTKNIIKTMEKLGGDPKIKDTEIKIKTNRSQWFD